MLGQVQVVKLVFTAGDISEVVNDSNSHEFKIADNIYQKTLEVLNSLKYY
jgi:hypothetical protein